MKTKKLIAAVLTGVMALSLTACRGASPNPGAGAASGDADKTYTIGIVQFLQHPALDAATKGFQDKLTALLGEDKVKFDYQNASNDANTVPPIISGFISSNVDLILANATPPLSAAAAATDSIPVLGTSVTDYGTALDISDWTGTTGRNISGTSDLAPLEEQAAMLKELFPDAKNVGLLYSSGEPNSQYQINIIKPILEGMGYACTAYSFADSNDLASVCTSALNTSDVIYVPTDNTVAGNTEIIRNITVPAGVPVIAGEQGICSGTGVATLSIDYYELGQTTGQMAYDILAGGKDISTMAVQFAPTVKKMYNADICAELGITPPADYIAIEG